MSCFGVGGLTGRNDIRDNLSQAFRYCVAAILYSLGNWHRGCDEYRLDNAVTTLSLRGVECLVRRAQQRFARQSVYWGRRYADGECGRLGYGISADGGYLNFAYPYLEFDGPR